MNDQNTSLKTFHLLLPYLWPKQRGDLKLRVMFALFFLVLAKAANVFTPLILGQSVDSLNALSGGKNILIMVPLALIVAYGVARLATLAFGEIRDALFSKVSQHAMRQIGRAHV